MSTTIGPNVYVPEARPIGNVNQPNPVNPPVNTVQPNSTANPTPQTTNIPTSQQVTTDASHITTGNINPERVAGAMGIVDSMEGGRGSRAIPSALLNPNGSSNVSSLHTTIEGAPAMDPSLLSARVNLRSRDERISFSGSTTQLLNRVAPEYMDGCAASCIVNGAMIEGGAAGLNGLVDVIRHHGNESEATNHEDSTRWATIPGFDQLNAISTRINNNSVTRGDLLTLQGIVYHQLSHMEASANHGTDPNATVAMGTVRDYMSTDTSSSWHIGTTTPLRDTFRHADIRLLDLDGNNTSDHFVVGFQASPSNAGSSGDTDRVFDPWPRTSGVQVEADSGTVEAYRHATLHVAFPR